MRVSLVAFALAVFTTAGVAQVPPAPPPPASQPVTPHPAVPRPVAPLPDISADMEAMLRKAGFTELQIMPDSVFVRGKDKAGNPVAMILNPHSMTEMVVLDPHAGTAAGGNGSAAPLTGSGTFATILPTEKLATALIGRVVQNAAGDKIGTIKDIAIDHGGVQAYIIGVGGFLGIGDRYVAVTPRAMSLAYDGATKTYRATTSATVDQLKAAPAFQFEEFQAAKHE